MNSWSKIGGVVLSLILVSGFVAPADAKFRDAINFEDNSFVGISQLEVFHSYTMEEGNEDERFDGNQFQYQITGGMMTNFELGARLPIKFFDNGTDGIGDFSIFQRFKFSQETDVLPESSGGIELVLPTGDDRKNPPTGTDEFNARLFGTVGKSIDSDLRWLAHGAVTLMGDDRFDDKWEYNAALRHQSNRYLKLVGEVNGVSGGIKDETQLFVSPGAILRTEGEFNVMLSVPIGVTSASTDFKPTVQFAYEF